jgi:hypothetical protein
MVCVAVMVEAGVRRRGVWVAVEDGFRVGVAGAVWAAVDVLLGAGEAWLVSVSVGRLSVAEGRSVLASVGLGVVLGIGLAMEGETAPMAVEVGSGLHPRRVFAIRTITTNRTVPVLCRSSQWPPGLPGSGLHAGCRVF